MSQALLDRTVGELVAERPARAKVFEKLGIDYCCKGNVALSEACEAKGADAAAVAAELAAEPASPGEGPDAPWRRSVDALVDHIVTTHHAYLREALPRLGWITDKVAKVHGAKDARLGELAAAFAAFARETEEHLNKEEAILFPFCKILETGQRPPFPPTVTMPVRTMMREHVHTGRPWRPSGASRTASPCPRAPATPGGPCWTAWRSWRRTSTPTSTWRTRSSSPGRSGSKPRWAWTRPPSPT
ncbi:MAG TPA: DUF542 domain-containing protein [Holophagaceae bacterium]|nr:DUF542 domain-containing protein [Holophagaceae bacterium]